MTYTARHGRRKGYDRYYTQTEEKMYSLL